MSMSNISSLTMNVNAQTTTGSSGGLAKSNANNNSSQPSSLDYLYQAISLIEAKNYQQQQQQQQLTPNDLLNENNKKIISNLLYQQQQQQQQQLYKQEQLNRLQPKDMNCTNMHCQCYQISQQQQQRVSHQLKQHIRPIQPHQSQQFENNNKKIINILKEQQELKLNLNSSSNSNLTFNQSTPTLPYHKKTITSRLEKAKELARKINTNEMIATSTPNTTNYHQPKLTTPHFNHYHHHQSPLATSSPIYANQAHQHQSGQHVGSFNLAQAQSGSYYPVDMLSHLLPHIYSQTANPYMKLMSQSSSYPSQQDQYYLQNLINLILTVNSFQQQQQQQQQQKTSIHITPPQLNLANTGQHIPLLSPISPATHGSFFSQHIPIKQSTPKREDDTGSRRVIIGDSDVKVKVDEHFKRSLGVDYYNVYYSGSKRPRLDENNNHEDTLGTSLHEEESLRKKQHKDEKQDDDDNEANELDRDESDDANNYSLISQSSVEPQCISTDDDADLTPPSSMPTPPLSISSHYAATKRIYHQPHSLNEIVDVHFSKALGRDMWNKIKQKLQLNSSLSEHPVRFSSSSLSSSVRTMSPTSSHASSLPASPVQIDH